ncbi:MFS transporter [Hephaestia mangrovi]|uniref:MFS transporter n=1 Tax=Hephaestia mangrovi TaxID=2873268 RepID=UPI001CA7AB3A|nr:MFS transporter [Hephaestia mangrovi]MBY8829391.1 MFS transporter [Hephaestia mangrovi]
MSDRPATSRWTILAIAWLALLLSFIDRLAWSSVAAGGHAPTGIPLSSLGSFASAFFAGYVMSNVIGGLAADRFGARLALAASLAMLGVFTAGFSLAAGVASGIALQALMGLAAGADYAATIKLMTVWFGPASRAKAIGLLMTALPVGVIVANAVLPRALGAMSWQALFVLLGAATIALGLLALIGLREAPDAMPPPRSRPGDLLIVLRQGELARLALVGFGAAWGTWGFAFWATALMTRGRGLSPIEAGLATTLFGAAAIIAKPATGWLSDRISRRKPLIVAVLAIYAAGLLLFGQLTAPLGYQIVAAFLGFFGFSWGPLLATLIAEAGGRSGAGTATGATNALQQMGGVVVPLAIGGTFAATGSFALAFVVMAAGPITAALVMALFCRDADYAPRATGAAA